MTDINQYPVMANDQIDGYSDEDLDSDINDIYTKVVKTGTYDDDDDDDDDVIAEIHIENHSEHVDAPAARQQPSPPPYENDNGPVAYHASEDGEAKVNGNGDASEGHYDPTYYTATGGGHSDDENHYSNHEVDENGTDDSLYSKEKLYATADESAETEQNEKNSSQPVYANEEEHVGDGGNVYNNVEVPKRSVKHVAAEYDAVGEADKIDKNVQSKKPTESQAKKPQSLPDNSSGSKKKQQQQQQQTAPSGKFVLRTLRNADALHCVRQARGSSSADNNPELDELETVIRSADRKSTSRSPTDEAPTSPGQKEKSSLIAFSIINKFEKAIATETRVDENDEYETDDAFENTTATTKQKTSQPYATSVIVHTVRPTSPTSPPIVNSTAKPKPKPTTPASPPAVNTTGPPKPTASASPVVSETDKSKPTTPASNSTEKSKPTTPATPPAANSTQKSKPNAPAAPPAANSTQKSKTNAPATPPAANSTEKSKTITTAAPPAANSTEKAKPATSTSPTSPSSTSQMQKPTYGTQTSNSGKTNSQTNGESTKDLQTTTSSYPSSFSVPTWKSDIETRKKTKAHVQAQKPKEPIKMSEVPEWKKQLQEKHKIKRQTSGDETDIPTSKIHNPSAANAPWKVELERLRSINDEEQGNSEPDLPEWARLADEKKKQTVQTDVNGNCTGYIPASPV